MPAKLCVRCNHPQDWHRLDDAINRSPADPTTPFRCLGYDCEVPGATPHSERDCDCPDFVSP